MEGEWIKVSDKLPEFMEDVLLTNGSFIYIGYLDKGKDRLYWFCNVTCELSEFTHWRKLPDLPK